jgi:hypothetical protein
VRGQTAIALPSALKEHFGEHEWQVLLAGALPEGMSKAEGNGSGFDEKRAPCGDVEADAEATKRQRVVDRLAFEFSV